MTGEMLGRLLAALLFPLLVMALVGGVYYLAARPRLSFRQAMFRWWVVLIGVGLLLLSLLGQMLQRIA